MDVFKHQNVFQIFPYIFNPKNVNSAKFVRQNEILLSVKYKEIYYYGETPIYYYGETPISICIR